MANRHRPRRGPAGSNVLVTGDTGTTAGPQGGAKPGASESGDLEAREFGVPQADIPGGLRHKVNPEATVAETTDKPRRPADYHKYHGVPSDDGQYAVTPGVEDDKPVRAEAEPVLRDAVPVYIVQEGTHGEAVRRFLSEGPLTIPVTFPATAAGAEPLRILNRDHKRSQAYITVETANGTIRIGSYEDAQDGRGLKVVNQTTLTIEGQDDLWVANTGANPGVISVAWETEVEVGGGA